MNDRLLDAVKEMRIKLLSGDVGFLSNVILLEDMNKKERNQLMDYMLNLLVLRFSTLESLDLIIKGFEVNGIE